MKKFQVLKESNINLKQETEEIKNKILRILESSEFKKTIKKYQPELKVSSFY